MEQKSGLEVLATTRTYSINKFVALPFFCGLAALTVIMAVSEGMPYTLFYLVMLLMMIGIMAVIVLEPKNAICYDEEKQELVIRSGKTIFGALKRRTMPLNDISSVTGKEYATSMLGIIPSIVANADKGLTIHTTEKKTVKLKMVKDPKVVAEKIKALIYETKMRNYYKEN